MSVPIISLQAVLRWKEREQLDWSVSRRAPCIRRGIDRCVRVSTTSEDIATSSGEMKSVAPSDQDDKNVETWRGVLVPSFTVLLTGAQSAFIDFNFLSEWLPQGYVSSVVDGKDVCKPIRRIHDFTF